jgi:hypothetical protein
MNNRVINDTYDRISKILKNDQKYPYNTVAGLIIKCAAGISRVDDYYAQYPPLLDIVELGAALEYEGSGHHDELIRQIHYKMRQLKALLPDIS